MDFFINLKLYIINNDKISKNETAFTSINMPFSQKSQIIQIGIRNAKLINPQLIDLQIIN